MTLDELLSLARSFEISEQQTVNIEKDETVHAVHHKSKLKFSRDRGPPSGLVNYRGNLRNHRQDNQGRNERKKNL